MKTIAVGFLVVASAARVTATSHHDDTFYELHNLIHRDKFYFIEYKGTDKITRNTIRIIKSLLQLADGFLMVLSNLVTYSSPRVKLVVDENDDTSFIKKKLSSKSLQQFVMHFKPHFYGIFDDYCRKLLVIIHH